MKEHHSHIKYHSIQLAVYAVLAILIFIFREAMVTYLKYFVGTLMIIYALEEMLFEFIYSRKEFFKHNKVYLGFVELLLGLVLDFFSISFEATCVIWATWSIMRETHEVEEILSELQNIVPKVISGLESITVIVLAVLLIYEPTEHHAMIHIYLLLAELILTPLTPILDEPLSKKKSL